jgi:calcineurin-like phosphoesterase family protein
MNNKITKNYIIADTHFFHDALKRFCGRPEKFEQLIINNWKSTVKPWDIIFHLGDVTWGNQTELKSIITSLPGTKVLVRGNHDKNHSNNWFIKAGFSIVVEKVQIDNIILSHMPSVMNRAEIKRNIINIHGHFHNNKPSTWENYLKKRITNNHYLLVLENIDYKPVLLKTAITKKFVTMSKKILESEN